MPKPSLMYREIAGINATVQSGTPLFIDKNNGVVEVSASATPGGRKLRFPKIGVYAGKGTSHSWLWFVDMFEKMGFLDLVFLDETSILKNRLRDLDVVVISGGDTFAVAGALKKEGADTIRSFVEAGGLYIGSCAGAYLPMNSSKPPLDLFNFVDVKITNLSKTIPKAEISTCKFCICYGCDYIFHPVREEVELKTERLKFKAPMYGGPGMVATSPETILATYHRFTEKTAFLADRNTATKTLIGRAAVVRIHRGKGFFHLFGPHLEHPRFPQANKFIADMLFWDTSVNGEKAPKPAGVSSRNGQVVLTGKEAKSLVRDIKRELSNSRIVASGMEFFPVSWLIGEKYYEPAKIRVFVESMWKRVKPLEKMKQIKLSSGDPSAIIRMAKQTTQTLRDIRRMIDQKKDSLNLAILGFDLLHDLSIIFYDIYFQNISEAHIK